MPRALRKEKLVETAERLQGRIEDRFPKSGLGKIAVEVVDVCKEAVERAEKIRRPDLLLRAGLVVIALTAIGGIVAYLNAQEDQVSAILKVVGFLQEFSGAAAFLAAAALFLVTLEGRIKRQRALQAIHELRAIAHLVDMHQLTKDPDRLGRQSIDVAGQNLDAFTMGRYLAYCTELLALLSKIAQIYVQDFPDGTAMAAVDQFEN
ncbi:MAG: hypothetical protein AB7K24_18840, partial [Gemmataceae bacterium]